MLIKILVIIGLMFFATDLAAQRSGGPPFVKSYYLSMDPVTGDQVLFQCADGYHLANIWEIYNMSSLSYNAQLGQTDDSGVGPPEGVRGWMATGSPVWANCENWTAIEGAGVFGELQLGRLMDWGGQPNITDGWMIEHHPCNHPIPVWCASD